jgi:hypothetical protein
VDLLSDQCCKLDKFEGRLIDIQIFVMNDHGASCVTSTSTMRFARDLETTSQVMGGLVAGCNGKG